MTAQNLILVVVLLPFICAIIAATLPVNARNTAAWFSGLTLAAGLVIMASLYGSVTEGMVQRADIRWVPSIGLELSFRMDGFAWLFVTLVQGIGVLVVIYARYYMAKSDPVPRLYSFLMAFAGAMIGVVLSGNVIMLSVFWELTSIISFLLIGYWYQNPAARDGARTSLIITIAGGLCLLASMLMMGRIVGSYDLDVILNSGDTLRNHPQYAVVLILLLLAAFTKSAQFPFHFWLPGAMTAPTPVSAFLHSATMVKAGVFLLIRFFPVLGGTEIWFFLVAGTGAVTMMLGAVIAVFRHDLKGLLAYSTISNLGLITVLAGIGSPGAIFAAIFHIINHAVFKASLFMAAGIVDHETGTRDMRKLSGLFHAMPITATLAIVASAAMGGVPFLNGFVSKEMFFAEAVDWHNGTWLDNAMPWLATFTGVFFVAYSLRFIMQVFFGPVAEDLPRKPQEPSLWMRGPVEALVLICLIVGIFPQATLSRVLNVAARSVLGERLPEVDIAVWHGFNAPLVMSLITMSLGTLFYFAFTDRISRGPEGPPIFYRIRAQRIYDWLMLRLTWSWPRLIHRLFGTEKLQPQLRLLVLLVLAAGSIAAGIASWRMPPGPVNTMNLSFVLMWGIGAACAIGAATLARYHRLAALILLGGAGLVTCLTFAWLSAPDLALTQLLVEVVTTILLLLGLRWLPMRRAEIPGDSRLAARLRRTRDLVIAALAGTALAALAYVVMTRPLIANVGDWFRRNAWYEGGGTNVVNVILVDFRAFDTFGEITVLAIVALTVFALLRRFRPAPESLLPLERESGEDERALRDYIYIPSVIMRWMFPVMIMASAYLFFRGHDLPGGGFSAGVMLATALLLQYIAANVRWIEMRIIIRPTRWMGLGLLIAGGAGAAAFMTGYPFLTAIARYVEVPLIGKVPASTAMLFDLGVFALVVGATVLMLIAIAHQSLRSARLRELEEDKAAEKAVEKESG